MSTELFLDYLAVRLNGSQAGDRELTLALVLPEAEESWTLIVRNGALTHREGAADAVDARVTIARVDLNGVILGTAPMAEQIAEGRARVEGDEQAVRDFIALLDGFDFWFDIVTP